MFLQQQKVLKRTNDVHCPPKASVYEARAPLHFSADLEYGAHPDQSDQRRAPGMNLPRMKLANRLRLEPRLRTRGVIHPLTPYVFTALYTRAALVKSPTSSCDDCVREKDEGRTSHETELYSPVVQKESSAEVAKSL